MPVIAGSPHTNQTAWIAPTNGRPDKRQSAKLPHRLARIKMIKAFSGVVLRCYGSRTGIAQIDSRCGWVGDSGTATVVPFGEHRCPKCGGSTTPPPKGRTRAAGGSR